MTTCPRHPDIPSTDLCVECGDYVCGQCATVLADRRVLCPTCNDRIGAAAPPPRPDAPETWEAPPPPKPKMGFPKYEVVDGGRARKPTVDWGAAAQKAKPSGRATAAMVLGLLSCACPAAALFSLVLGIQELNAIKAGKAPAAGKTQATVGVALGALMGLFMILWIIGAAASGK
jgi:hypothetical protein